ncbi:MAG: hypothetical protein ACOCXJ_05795, partial [Planctomycetota bacterium]
MVLPPTDAGADPLHNLIGFQLGRAHAAARSLVERELRAAGLADVLTSGMGPVLYHLFEHDGCTISDIVH